MSKPLLEPTLETPKAPAREQRRNYDTFVARMQNTVDKEAPRIDYDSEKKAKSCDGGKTGGCCWGLSAKNICYGVGGQEHRYFHS